MQKRIFKFWPLFIVLLFALAVAWPTFMPGYFSHHDDLQVMRIFEMRKCIEDFQIPCRWVPDMGYGNGYPLFNYYAVSPYYIGAILSYLVGFLGAAKLLFAIPIFLGAISMYFLAKELFGHGILPSVLYTFAPYKALDIYVRGDVTESFAIALIPLVFYFCLKLIREKKVKYMVGLSLSLGSFLTSHNIMTLLFFPVFLILTAYFLAIEKWKNSRSVLISIVIGIGLSAFFIFPAYFEKNLVQIENLIRLDLNFRAHFVTINQLFFSRFWGYGASSPGINDTISFQVGWPHWWLVMAALVAFAVKRKFKLFPLLLFGIFIFSVFMAHIKSSFIWEKIDVLKFTQFPWRFLSVAAFSGSLLGGYFISGFGQSQRKYLVAILVVLTVVLNWNYFKPNQFYFDLTDQEKLSGKLWEDQQKAAILDYLPQTAVQPREAATSEPVILEGKAKVSNFENKSNRWQFRVKTEDKTKIELPVFEFPVWKVKINNEDTAFTHDSIGRIIVDIPKNGDYSVSGKFTNTPIRNFSNLISLISLITLIWIAVYGKNYTFFR